MVDYTPSNLKYMILQNKDHIIDTIHKCIHQDKMNMLLTGCVPKHIVNLIIKEYYEHYPKPNKQVIMEIDCFSDLNLSSSNNELILFSKCPYKKFVVIHNLEHIPENIQVYFKNIMNEYTFFIFCSDCKKKVYESVYTRCVPIDFKQLDYYNSKQLLHSLCVQEQITIEDYDEVLNQTQLNIDYMINLMNYMKLLKKTTIEKGSNYITLIKNNELEQYFQHIKSNHIKDAYLILFDYYDKGFSILDIYYFLYEYSKTQISEQVYFKIIELLCEYIHNIYEGHDHKIWLALLTNDINNIYK